MKQQVLSGVPQGSIIGPHLFSAYITSVLQSPVSFGTRILAFADDQLIIKQIRDEGDCVQLQSDIDLILDSYSDLFLSINPSKSGFMVCSLACLAKVAELPILLSVHGAELEEKRSLKYLGVTIDPRLSFGEHTELIAPKVKSGIGAVFRTLGKFTSKKNFEVIYKAKILPIFLHALPFACPVLVHHWDLLEKTNRLACRLIANDYRSSYQQLLDKLHWKPIARLEVERQLLMMFKYSKAERHFPAEALHQRPIRPSRINQTNELQFD